MDRKHRWIRMRDPQTGHECTVDMMEIAIRQRQGWEIVTAPLPSTTQGLQTQESAPELEAASEEEQEEEEIDF